MSGRISFMMGLMGYPQARAADTSLITLSSMLESDRQDDFSIEYTLKELRKSLNSQARLEITGNAHTIVVEGDKASIECDDDPSLPTSRISTTDLIEIVLAWQSFRKSGTPESWPLE